MVESWWSSFIEEDSLDFIVLKNEDIETEIERVV